MSPREIAQAIVGNLGQAEFVGRVEIAGAGFINVALSQEYLSKQIETITRQRESWGTLHFGKGLKVQVEFVSANPTGPLHIGRTWGAVIGDTYARLLERCGYHVSREYYFNNAGRQMMILGQSVRARYLQQIGQPAEFPPDGYQGEYIASIANDIFTEEGNSWADADWQPFKERAEAWLLADIRGTLDRLGVSFDIWYNEQELYATGAVEKTLAALRALDFAYDTDGAVWFRATAFGVDKDRVLVRSNGEPTYRLPDIAYHINKLQRGFDLIVDVLGVDHKDEFPDVVHGVRALGHEADRIRVLFHQFINLVQDGKAMRMSTRRANYVTLDDLLDAVTLTHPDSGITIPGKDPVRFMLLTRAPSSPMNFDLNLVTRQSNDNPVYYVQYAHARMVSILRKATSSGYGDWAAGDIILLQHPTELDLIRRMLELPEWIERAVHEMAPHYLSNFARDLAEAFHSFYHECQVIAPETVILTLARLKLVDAARIVLAQTLDLMGMSAPEQM